MKSGSNRSLITAALALVGLGTQANTTDNTNTHVLHPSPVKEPTIMLLRRSHPHLSQSPPYNQRKARKARRQRFAAGDRHTFKR